MLLKFNLNYNNITSLNFKHDADIIKSIRITDDRFNPTITENSDIKTYFAVVEELSRFNDKNKAHEKVIYATVMITLLVWI